MEASSNSRDVLLTLAQGETTHLLAQCLRLAESLKAAMEARGRNDYIDEMMRSEYSAVMLLDAISDRRAEDAELGLGADLESCWELVEGEVEGPLDEVVAASD